MAYIYKNITGSRAHTILQGHYYLKNIHLTNIHATDSVKVDISLQDTYPGTLYTDPNLSVAKPYDYYIIKNLRIPYGASLILEEKDLEYDTNYNLVIKLSESDSTVDMIIRDTSDITTSRSPHIQQESVTRTNISSPYAKVLPEGSFKSY